MEKIEVLQSIRAARRAHIQWVDRAKSLVNGLSVKKEQIPLEVTECSFGKWFYCDGQILLSFFTEEAITKLDNKHKELHDIYMKIFKIYFPEPKGSFLTKLFMSRVEITAQDEHNALAYLRNLEEVSKELISFLNIIEQKLNKVDEATFAKYM
ncbi:MAG: Methyl-accepting chemotaxis protein [uncultured Sulfurovum sp.]|uniref:Methyl-accepting chemotaxis protein n=1 Tax=uncultured Sulfurovum sp. TaxID=269237 RepID=A0A6S6RXV4_9BACT|nr:MAG: Methyl-accepting chemotaxis protein [uncultured Sulfurovum sp.]